MNELIKIIEGLNEERTIITKAMSTEYVISYGESGGVIKFIERATARINEIDKILVELKKDLLTPHNV